MYNLKTTKNMKVLNKILLLSLFAPFFIACGDDSPEMEPEQKTVEYVYTWPVRGLEEGETKYELELSLADVIGIDAAKNFKRGEFQLASSYMRVVGLEAMDPSPVLKNFSLQVGKATPVNFGNCTATPRLSNDFASELKQSSNTVTNFLLSVFSAYTSKSQSAKITVSFVPTHDVIVSDGVVMQLVITGTYNYNVRK